MTLGVKITRSGSDRLEAFRVFRIWVTRGPKVICWRPECEERFGHVIVVLPVLPSAESSTNPSAQRICRRHEHTTCTKARSSTTPLHMLHMTQLPFALCPSLSSPTGILRKAVVNSSDITTPPCSSSARRLCWPTVAVARHVGHLMLGVTLDLTRSVHKHGRWGL